MSKDKQFYEPSALKKILTAGVKGASSPSSAAKILASLLKLSPPSAESAGAQSVQALMNMGATFSKEFMAATVRQHGPGPSALLRDLEIRKSLSELGNKGPVTATIHSATNKGIEAARLKAAANQYGNNAMQSTNKGIESYRNKASGQSTDNSKSSGGQSNASGQER